jgi:hypothetical protein
MKKPRHLHWADAAGIIIAVLLIVAGLASVLRPQRELVFFHSSGDMNGNPIEGVREIATPETIRFYGIIALSLGCGLALFMWWALKTTDNE